VSRSQRTIDERDAIVILAAPLAPSFGISPPSLPILVILSEAKDLLAAASFTPKPLPRTETIA